jgi:hypothetical protein
METRAAGAMVMEVFERTLLVVHGSRPASVQEWNRYLAQFINPGLSGVLIVVDSSYPGPTALQRAQATDAAKQAGIFPHIAVVTGSRMHRGIVTVVSWMQRGNLVAFSPRELPAAMDHVGLEPERRGVALSRVHELARRIGALWITQAVTL